MKIDLKKQIPSYTAPRGRFEIVTVPPLQFLMIDGHGDPNTSGAYADALATLFPIAYALKFFSKRELDRDYTVMPLEALWWADDMDSFTTARDKSQWSWTLMNLVPDWITVDHLDVARQVAAKKGDAPVLDMLRMKMLDEGQVVQTLHIGSYDDEAPVLNELHSEFIPAHSLRMTGRHHEIYLSDPRRTASDKLKTILRQPVSPAGEPSQ
ncbi:GyrI-like domain-containing protein [Leifsonia flava]|uniref:GyrI-like domain-containing protein n=1 Tax=Orlajensenia leifsoniae TaxID=2561933 RepID=UPI001F0141BA|nr:GyrI-like domain-containing protein [Leifsonia flava]